MLVAAGLEVSVEAGAGASAFIPDDLYEKAGATVASRGGTVLRDADAVLKVQAPRESEISLLKKGAVLISFLQPATQGDIVRSLASHGITAFSLELLPRISRAQSMDALSSQASAAGSKAVLVTAEMVRGMRPGSVIVDLAAETGGNVELTQPGKEADVNGVTIIGTRNIPSTMPLTTSQLFARNVANLLLHLVKNAAVSLDFTDEITKGACVTHGGEIVNERAKQALSAA